LRTGETAEYDEDWRTFVEDLIIYAKTLVSIIPLLNQTFGEENSKSYGAKDCIPKIPRNLLEAIMILRPLDENLKLEKKDMARIWEQKMIANVLQRSHRRRVTGDRIAQSYTAVISSRR